MRNLTGGCGLDGPLNEQKHRQTECGSEHEKQVARKKQGREGTTGLRNRFSISAGGLVKPASLPEPPFAEQKDERARDQHQAQAGGRGVVESSGHLLIHGVGKGLKAQQRNRAEIRSDVENRQEQSGDQ